MQIRLQHGGVAVRLGGELPPHGPHQFAESGRVVAGRAGRQVQPRALAEGAQELPVTGPGQQEVVGEEHHHPAQTGHPFPVVHLSGQQEAQVRGLRGGGRGR
ncbi:hypothetical protein ACFQ2B_30900 [Streptomyces stramineus]